MQILQYAYLSESLILLSILQRIPQGDLLKSTRKGRNHQYYDTQAELNALRTQEERLLDLLEQAQSLDDILKLEEQLGTIRTKIEKLTTRLNQLNNLVNFATMRSLLKRLTAWKQVLEHC